MQLAGGLLQGKDSRIVQLAGGLLQGKDLRIVQLAGGLLQGKDKDSAASWRIATG